MISATFIVAAFVFAVLTVGAATIFVGGSRRHERIREDAKGWFRRELRPFGAMIFAGLLLCLMLVPLLHVKVARNEAVKQAIARAQQSNEVNDYLGAPVQVAGFQSTGYGGWGEGARVSAGITLRGSKQKGTLLVCGISHDGRWQLAYAEFTADSGFAKTLNGTRALNPCTSKRTD